MINNEIYLNSPIEIERELLEYFNKNSKLVIFDIGSCDGLDSIKYSRFFPNSIVYSFEPLTKNFEEINRNIAVYKEKNIKPINKALSDVKGLAEFHVSSGKPEDLKVEGWDFGNKSSSLLEPDKTLEIHPWLKFEEKIEVETITISNFCNENSINEIDFIHMDVQGAELKVLSGTLDMISKIKMIWLEVENVELYKSQPIKKDIEFFMKNKGFTKIKDTVSNIAGDQLWVNFNFFPKKRLTHFIWKKYESIFLKKKKTHIKISPEEYLKKSYSQCGEDLIIDYVFKVKGLKNYTFLDIGAHHPYYINNTFLSYSKGNRGVSIEPNPEFYNFFLNERPFDVNLNIGISDQNGVLEYFLFDNPTLNTFSTEEKDILISKGYKLLNTMYINVLNINDIIKEHFNSKSPNVIFIDVEGFDYQIISSLNFDKYYPDVICIETISYETNGSGIKNKQIIDFIENKGYILYADTNVNSIFVKRDFWIR